MHLPQPQQKIYDEMEAHQSRAHHGLGFGAEGSDSLGGFVASGSDAPAPEPAAAPTAVADSMAEAVAKAKAIAEKLARAAGIDPAAAAPASKRRWNDDSVWPRVCIAPPSPTPRAILTLHLCALHVCVSLVGRVSCAVRARVGLNWILTKCRLKLCCDVTQ